MTTMPRTLLVVDVQVGVMASAWDADRIVGNVAHAVERARARHVPVLWVQHADDDELPHGSPAWQWVPALAQATLSVIGRPGAYWQISLYSGTRRTT